MGFKNFIAKINPMYYCRGYGIPPWQCPQLLFTIMGLVIIVAIFVSYIVGQNYIEDPLLVAMIVLFVAAVLFVISTVITQGFERLLEANKMKSEFIGIVSHQLRSPISNLRWALDFLSQAEGDIDEEKETEYFTMLRENARRMGDLVSDLLMVAKIEQGKFTPVKEEVDLKDIIKNTVIREDFFIKSSNVEVVINADEGVPKILVDVSQIKMVVENFLDNAIRYSKTGGRVIINLKQVKGEILFEIKDDGVGIPEEDRKYIFQKFFRAKNAVRYKTEGSGLGLYVCKSIIEKLGGEIGFRSQEGIGSTFWFTLPIKKA